MKYDARWTVALRGWILTGAFDALWNSSSPTISSWRMRARTPLRRSFAAFGFLNREYRFGEQMIPASTADSSREISFARFEK
jgi:hypothetical protein